jgi:probable selenium-dependent hydroxylase accessory protein YqeC
MSKVAVLFVYNRETRMTSLSRELALGKKGVISLVGAGGKTSLMFRLAHELSAAGDTVLTTTTTKIHPPAGQSKYLLVSDSPSDILNKARKLLTHTPHISAAARHAPAHGKLVGFPPETIDLFVKSNLFRWIIVEADGAAGRPLKAPAPHEPVVPDCTNWVIGIVGLSALGKPLDNHTVFRPALVSQITGLAEGKEITGKTICDLLLHRQGIFQGTPMGAKKIVFLNQADIPRKAQAGRSIIHYLVKKKPMDISRVILGSISLEAAVLEYRDLHHPLL